MRLCAFGPLRERFTVSGMLLLSPINVLNDLLLQLGLSEETITFFFWPLIQIGLVVTLVALWVAYATYLERKISAFMQARLGPMRVGPWGLLQPIADGLKLLTKEDFIPENADRWIFFFAPYIAVASAFIVFSVIPFGPDWAVIADVNIGLLLVLAVSSVGVLALILAGWSSNSKYALLGGLRSSAQMVSYEVAMGLSLIGALMFARTLSLSGIVAAQGSDSIWFFVYQPAGFLLFLISGIAENNRAPFDLPEAESELVAGFHTEYSGMRWSLFFMAEYAAMVVVAAVATTVYLGGWYFPFVYRLETAGYHNLFVIVSVLVFSGQSVAHSLLLFLAALDVAAVPLRSVDGHWLEVADSVGVDQYRVVGVGNLRRAGAKWLERNHDDRVSRARFEPDGDRQRDHDRFRSGGSVPDGGAALAHQLALARF